MIALKKNGSLALSTSCWPNMIMYFCQSAFEVS
jgi:hypothetical protein